MTRTYSRPVLLVAAAVLAAAGLATAPLASAQVAADPAKTITLPAPQKTGGKPLMQALAERQSAREFGSQKLAPQVLSNLLWAAWGVNRPDGRRTAPSARNWQDIDVYVTLPEGLYLYDAKGQALTLAVPEDLRGATGSQPFPAQAALNLVYVSDGAKIPGTTPEVDRAMYSGAHTGFIAQNVYLFCASEGLVTVVRALVDRPALAKRMQLRPEQRITLVQTVGYKK